VTRRLARALLFGCAAVALTAAPARAQVTLVKAKELYAAANYDEALTMLNALGSPSVTASGPLASREDLAAIAMYRVLCLVAVGRTGEVDSAIDRLVSEHPLYRPATDELSPRMRTAISTARVRVLPALVQKRYAESKAAYDRGDFANSSSGFKWVLTALADPDISNMAGQSPLADIKTLASGFVDLSEKALVPPPPPKPTAVVAAAPAAAIATPTRDLKKIYSVEDSDVVAPVTIKQNMPRFPGVLTTAASGVLEVVIDVAGGVESVRLLESVHPQYDGLVIANAKKWLYQPAKLEGTPVKYTKRIQVSLAVSEASPGRR
jgi:hypothetical protein